MSAAIFASAAGSARNNIAKSIGEPRVLLVGSALKGGGAENRLKLLAQRLFNGTADVVTLHSGTHDLGISDHRVYTLGWRGKAHYPRAIIKLRKLLISHRYDAAISLGLYPNVVLWAASRGLAGRPALIMTEITRPRTESLQFSRPLAGRLRQPLYRLSYSGADLVAANSELGLNEVVTYYGVAGSQARRIPNLIDVARVRSLSGARVELNCTNPSVAVARICLVARFDPIKRIDTLIRAAHALGSETIWHLDLVGDGKTRPSIEALTRELGIEDRVTFHGWVTNPYPVMANAAATVLCSEYEGFSNTVLESMVVGTPVITSYCSLDARMMVEDGAALGFEIGDWSALSDRLAVIMTRPDIAYHLQLRGQLYAARHHAETAISEYETIVRDAIALRQIPLTISASAR